MKVRLKQTQIMKLNAEGLFQFHEGPIKTVSSCLIEFFLQVSIP